VVLGLAVWAAEAAAARHGAPAADAQFGDALLLFFLSLPWSLPVWALMLGAGALTGADGPSFMRPFFFAMPAVAGAGWGVVVALVIGRSRRGRHRAGVT